MKKTFLFIAPVIAALLSSCASKHPGNMAESTSAKKVIDMKLSGISTEKDKESPFQLIEVTIENPTNDWIRINRAEVLIGDPAKSKVSVVVGSDLAAWAEAKQYDSSLKRQNAQMAQAGMAVAGAAVATAGAHNGDKNMMAAGVATYGGAVGWAASDAVNQSIEAGQGARKVPSQHLYHPFSVPGKMFLRRWILLNKPVGVLIDNLAVEFETVEGKKETYVIKM